MKNTRLGQAIGALFFMVSFAFFGCANPESPDGGRGDIGYRVAVEPGSFAVILGGGKEFRADLYRDGQLVSDAAFPEWTVTANSGSKHASTGISYLGTLSVASAETAAVLTVSASITYNNVVYKGTSAVHIVNNDALLAALQAIRAAESTGTLLSALKNPQSGVDVDIVNNKNKDNYFSRKSDFASYVDALPAAPTTLEIIAAVAKINELIKEINLAHEAAGILNAFNTAADADAIHPLITKTLFTTFSTKYPETLEHITWYWDAYSILSDKAAVTQAIFQSRQNMVNSTFTDDLILIQTVSMAIDNQRAVERAALFSLFTNQPAAVIKPLLTQFNLRILGMPSTILNMYESLNVGGTAQEQIAEALAETTFRDLDQIYTIIRDTIAAMAIEEKGSQIRSKLDTAISGTATVAQINEFCTFVLPLLDENGFSFGWDILYLPNNKLNAYTSVISSAKTNYGFDAIRKYANLAPGVDTNEVLSEVLDACKDVATIIWSLLEGAEYGTLTITGIPDDADDSIISDYAVHGLDVYNMTTLPAHSEDVGYYLSVLWRAPFVKVDTIPAEGITITLILPWSGSFTGSKARAFVVSLSYTYALVTFDSTGNATVAYASFDDLPSRSE